MSELIAVADTTPLRYLIEIGQVDLLSHLFREVLVSPAVVAELSDAATPATVRNWVANPPQWLKVIGVARTRRFPQTLQAGECDAIELALSVPCDLILMDDRAARMEARRLGLNFVGKLGILERADMLGVVQDFETTLHDLCATNIRVPDWLVTQSLERHRKRITG